MSNTYYLHLRTRPLTGYIAGNKKLEGRIGKPPYNHIAIGDEIIFDNDEDPADKRVIYAKVIAIYKFPTFEEAFETLDPKEAIPQLTKQGAIEVYHTLYSNQAIQQYGAFFFRLDIKRVEN